MTDWQDLAVKGSLSDIMPGLFGSSSEIYRSAIEIVRGHPLDSKLGVTQSSFSGFNQETDRSDISWECSDQRTEQSRHFGAE